MELTQEEKECIIKKLEKDEWDMGTDLGDADCETEAIYYLAGKERFVDFVKDLVKNGEVVEKKDVCVMLRNSYFTTKIMKDSKDGIVVGLIENEG